MEEVSEIASIGIPFVNNTHPMWVYDLETLGFLEVNEAAIRAYGFSRREFMTMTLFDIRPLEDIQPLLQSWKHPRESTAESWRHMGKDGNEFAVSITSWQLDFRGRKAELVMARRDGPDNGRLPQAGTLESSSIASVDSADRGTKH
jgi:PAS domain S-box-containing protein